MFMKYNDQLIKIHHIFKYFLIIMICFHISNSTLANPKKIIKNVICKEKSILKDFRGYTQKTAIEKSILDTLKIKSKINYKNV